MFRVDVSHRRYDTIVFKIIFQIVFNRNQLYIIQLLINYILYIIYILPFILLFLVF